MVRVPSGFLRERTGFVRGDFSQRWGESPLFLFFLRCRIYGKYEYIKFPSLFSKRVSPVVLINGFVPSEKNIFVKAFDDARDIYLLACFSHTEIFLYTQGPIVQRIE